MEQISDHISFSEMKIWSFCRRWWQLSYKEHMPSGKAWSLSFYQGNLVDLYVKGLFVGQDLRPEKGKILSRSNFLGVNCKASIPLEEIEKRMWLGVQSLYKTLKEHDFVPGIKISKTITLLGKEVEIHAVPDFQKKDAVCELKVRSRALPFGMMLRDYIQLGMYKRIFNVSPENSSLLELFVSSAKKPDEVCRIRATFLSDVQKIFKFNLDEEIELLLTSTIEDRKSGPYNRTGLFTGGCTFCPYSDHCMSVPDLDE